ncbi:hypothetical protein Hanom_Chr09g00847361 [Helianthus anomalus]
MFESLDEEMEFKKTNDEEAPVLSASKANAIEAAGYGVGICAEYGGGAFRPYVWW